MDNQSLIEKAKIFFKLSKESPRGKKLVDSIRWTQIIKFIVDDKAEFYLDVKRGELEILPGDIAKKDAESEFYEISRVYTDRETLNALLEGKKDSVDAQYADEDLRTLPGGKYYVVSFVHQLFRFGRQELLDKKMREFERNERQTATR